MKPFFLLLAILLLVGTCTARPGDPTLYPPGPGEETVSVFLIDNGYHTDIALPGELLARTSGTTAVAARQVSPRNWVLAGWGDAQFYVETGMSRERALDGLRALFKPGNPSVIRLTGIGQRPDILYGERAVEIRLSRMSFALLVARIDRSLGEVRPAPAPRRPDQAFFRSVETFSILHLCNHWTAEVLSAGGVGVTPVLDTFTPGLRLDLWARRQLADPALDTARAGS